MCIIYAIANQKGGCSKTSVTVNLGVGLAMEGKNVLVIDADPQGSLTISLGYPDPDEIPLTLATVMTDIINENDFDEETLKSFNTVNKLYMQDIKYDTTNDEIVNEITNTQPTYNENNPTFFI